MVMARKNKHIEKNKFIRHWNIKNKYLRSKMKCSKKGSLFSTAQLATIVILASIFSLLMGMAIATPKLKKEDSNKSIEDFIKQYNSIKNEYYEDIDDEEAMKTAMDAIVNSLDAYTTVVDDSLSNTLTTRLQGTYQGFGIQVANDASNNLIIVDVIKDSPAEKAGLQIYDYIKKLDSEDVVGMTTTDFVNIVKNSPKASFTLIVEREGKDVTIQINREKVTLNSIATDIYERNNKKIGYIYVSLFAYNTDVQFNSALKELESKDIDSLIVDLRYNTGGHLSAVENMMSEFLNKKHVIYQIQTKSKIEKYYSKTDTERKYEVAVLVNNYSASASEMFAATMQEEYGATIIGTTTYGKGTVQELRDSSLEDKQYKLTTKKWLTPKGNWVNGKGVTPDIVIELNVPDEQSFTEDEDNQLQEAINILAK